MSDLRAGIAEHTRSNHQVDLRPLPTRSQAERQRQALAAAGMRALPYPFSSALTLTSDCDFSCRRHYSTYVGELVERHGLDFGDSVWLAAHPGRYNPRRYPGLAVLGPDLRLDARHFARERPHQLDTWEILREHHRGNVDHWHTFHPRGPRVFVLREWAAERGARRLRAPVGAVETDDFLFHGRNFPVVGATLVVDPGLDPGDLEVELLGRDGRRRALRLERDRHLYRSLGREVEEGRELFFTLTYEVRDRRRAPFLDEVAAVGIGYPQPLPEGALRALLLHNLHSGLILDRLDFLDRELHFSTNLSTAHGRWHLYTAHRLKGEGERVAALLRNSEADGKALYAAADLPGARFSTVADDPLSRVRVLPELTERFGIVFLRMVQGRRYVSHNLSPEPLGRRHCSLHDVVYPLRTRAGGVFYNLCAAFPEISREAAAARGVDPERSRAGDFDLRLRRVLDDLRRDPGELAVLYTHLGFWQTHGLEPRDEDPRPRRPASLDGPAVVELKDRVFDVSSTFGGSSRIWFTRPSVLADYALMAQTIPERVTRQDANTVRIESGVDPVLERRLPESARQLYGLTFHVDRRAAGRVFLDDREIRDLWRNPAGGAGRESVTVAECGIRCVIFDEVDPVRVRRAGQAGGRFEVEGGEWSWRTEPGAAFRGDGFGVLRLAGGPPRTDRATAPADRARPTARLELSCSGLEPVGCQQLAWALRRSSPRVAAAVLLETTSGGRFLFGDRELLAAAGEPSARYSASRAPADRAGWERIVAPFAALDWQSGSDPSDCPMPCHPPRRITLLVSGPPGAAAAFDALEYGRPKTTRPHHAGGTIVLGGRVAGARAGTQVGLLPATEAATAEPAIAETDELGGFWLRDLAPGAYRIATAGQGRGFDWTAATWVEAATDRFDLELEPARGGGGPNRP